MPDNNKVNLNISDLHQPAFYLISRKKILISFQFTFWLTDKCR